MSNTKDGHLKKSIKKLTHEIKGIEDAINTLIYLKGSKGAIALLEKGAEDSISRLDYYIRLAKDE